MANYILKSVKLYRNGDLEDARDVYLSNGKLVDAPVESSVEIDADGMELYPGLCELLVDSQAPEREAVYTFEHLEEAMLRGGYISVLIDSPANPIDDFRMCQELHVIAKSMKDVEVLFAGSLTIDDKGSELTEVLSMAENGIKNFTYGLKGVPEELSFFRSALEYVSQLESRVFIMPLESSLAREAHVHEGLNSDMLGMKGIPVEAEQIAVYKAIKMSKLTGCSIHLRGLSSAESIEMVEQAKQNGVDVSCDIALLSLLFNDSEIINLNSAFNVRPPLRNEEERHKLIECILDGKVDAISSMHIPRLYQDKLTGFETAKPGSLGLETAFLALKNILEEEIGKTEFLKKIVPLISFKPQKIINSNKEGYFLWNPLGEVKIDKDFFAGWVYNSPFLSSVMRGKIEKTLF